jgi:hypothetical protein
MVWDVTATYNRAVAAATLLDLNDCAPIKTSDRERKALDRNGKDCELRAGHDDEPARLGDFCHFSHGRAVRPAD